MKYFDAEYSKYLDVIHGDICEKKVNAIFFFTKCAWYRMAYLVKIEFVCKQAGRVLDRRGGSQTYSIRIYVIKHIQLILYASAGVVYY